MSESLRTDSNRRERGMQDTIIRFIFGGAAGVVCYLWGLVLGSRMARRDGEKLVESVYSDLVLAKEGTDVHAWLDAALVKCEKVLGLDNGNEGSAAE